MLKGSLILSTWLLLWAGGSTAQSIDLSIDQQAQAYLQAQLQPQLTPGDTLQIRLNKTDARLQLEPCANPIKFTPNRPVQTGSFSLKASCDYPRRWTRYLHGYIEQQREALISTRALNKGHRIQAIDMRPAAVNENDLRDGFYTQAQQIIGSELSRPIPNDHPFSPKLLTPPTLIQQGDQVRIQAGNNGITVEMTGTALEAGALHQQIEVKNNRSERVVKASVTGYGTVKVLH